MAALIWCALFLAAVQVLVGVVELIPSSPSVLFARIVAHFPHISTVRIVFSHVCDVPVIMPESAKLDSSPAICAMLPFAVIVLYVLVFAAQVSTDDVHGERAMAC
jgi:hypothetical protein